jgi:hypothetical protein
MALFLIIAPVDNSRIGAAVEATFAGEGEFFRVWNGQWFVSASGTAKDIAQKLGIGAESEGGIGSGVVVSVNSYWGRANADLWPWLSSKIEK